MGPEVYTLLILLQYGSAHLGSTGISAVMQLEVLLSDMLRTANSWRRAHTTIGVDMAAQRVENDGGPCKLLSAASLHNML